ncbi:phosphatase PAP2 family protein [uncultured Chryseobacterium sp.]|uniref:phosphatase PAP2 family protein n=1 Tax=uncultured Chryseobacterium sp. TaxID=259322 RepID=UPI0025D6DB0E|nr:phosphatase PAP2 family protein [uncultured Chryseobacterium sp.]
MKRFLAIFVITCPYLFYGQVISDSVRLFPVPKRENIYKPDYRKTLIPAVLIGYGVVSLGSDALKNLNSSTRNEIGEHQPKHVSLDNYAQYVPAVMVYGYNLSGIKGRHNFKDRTIIYATSQLISASFVLPLKYWVKEERPDGSNTLSFPSGHTATAFSSAQFLFREYQDENIWLAVSGYPIALFTGIYRTLNNKHWVGDVVAGAGFGILSTELAYWLFPLVNRIFMSNGKKSVTLVYPVVESKNFGAGIVLKF